jgi:hypothetical protein
MKTGVFSQVLPNLPIQSIERHYAATSYQLGS